MIGAELAEKVRNNLVTYLMVVLLAGSSHRFYQRFISLSSRYMVMFVMSIQNVIMKMF